MKALKNPELFANTDFSSVPANPDGFENCQFTNCTFPDLSNLKFLDCHFKTCNLSNLKTGSSLFQSVLFSDCKLLGLNFSGAKDFGFEVHFENCLLDYAAFDRKKMNKSAFKDCRLHNVNFTETDLSKCKLTNCDLFEALFSGTDLRGVDLTTCTNFLIDPELNKIKKAKFLLQSLPDLLYRYEIIVEK